MDDDPSLFVDDELEADLLQMFGPAAILKVVNDGGENWLRVPHSEKNLYVHSIIRRDEYLKQKISTMTRRNILAFLLATNVSVFSHIVVQAWNYCVPVYLMRVMFLRRGR